VRADPMNPVDPVTNARRSGCITTACASARPWRTDVTHPASDEAPLGSVDRASELRRRPNTK
jgi:hypothetical protein